MNANFIIFIAEYIAFKVAFIILFILFTFFLIIFIFIIFTFIFIVFGCVVLYYLNPRLNIINSFKSYSSCSIPYLGRYQHCSRKI
jgi:hypothetical protein